MTRRKRIALELLGPTVIASVAWICFILLSKGITNVGGFLQGAAATLLLVLLYSGLQSIAYTIIMEIAFRFGLNPRSFACITFSSFLGLLAGASVVVYGHGNMEGAAIANWSLFGGGVALLISVILFVSNGKTSDDC